MEGLSIGDVVKVDDEGMLFEGIIVGLENNQARVDLGDSVVSKPVKDCVLILRGTDLEVGDRVEFKSPLLGVYFVGVITRRNLQDNTFDIRCDNEDANAGSEIDGEGDMELGVPAADIRKLMTGRELAVSHFRKAVHTVQAINTFRKFSKLSSH